MPKLAIVTCLDLPEPDPDQELLVGALESAGLDATLAAWDNPDVDWSTFDVSIVRSTWDYPERPFEFCDWIDETAPKTKLVNPASILKWNVSKRYLSKLSRQGVQVVPTTYISRDSDLPQLNPWGSDAVVIKPVISAGSWLTHKFDRGQEIEARVFLKETLLDREMMIQPYLPSVESGGEVSWIWIDGEITHGVRKSPRFHDGAESVSSAVEPSAPDRELVAEILANVKEKLLYARIDLMKEGDTWLLSELELIEPSLFFLQNHAALDRFIGAARRLLQA